MEVIFADRILPDGSHVLVPVVRRPRTCERADHVAKRAYHHAYRCPNCGAFHLASKK